MIKSIISSVFVFCFFLHSEVKAAIDNVIYFNGKDIRYVGENLLIFKDISDSLTISDVINRPELFKSAHSEVPNIGLANKPQWIKFEIENLSQEDKLFINLSFPNIDHVKFYSVTDSGIDSVSYSVGSSYQDRKYNHQYYLFDLALKKGERATCYIQLLNKTQISVPISIQSLRGLFRFLQQEDILSAIYVGLMWSLILYNAFLYFSTKEKHYLNYVNYIFWVFVAQMAVLGLIERVFHIRSEWLSSRILTFTGAMSGIGAILFVKSFLQTAITAKRFNILLNIFLAGYVLAILLLLIGFILPAYIIVNLIAGGGAAFVLLYAFELSRRNYRQTHLFLYAWCIFLLSVLIFVLKDYGILPTNIFTTRSVQIGSVIEALLLSFALADKINTYRKEMLDLQVRELAISQENEKLIREQNIVLEHRVKERTEELQKSNKSLNLTLTNLREAQAQLVESEKMASLGQLTAGVAHEINNPINFVTSNVLPLRRDVGILWEIVKEIETIALNEEIGFEEKRKKIQFLKEHHDLDYLNAEINFLLKGMKEGAERTAEIVKSLKIFSRVDEESLMDANINDGIDSTLVILNSVTKDKIRIEKKYDDNLVIECYPGKLNQVFMNILSNAIYAIDKKFGSDLGGEIKIETKPMEGKSEVMIKISDNGVGIPNEIKNRIFEPFFTTKDVGEGTGLGMSIVYKTIERHKGKIILESEVGEGTSFTIILPTNQFA